MERLTDVAAAVESTVESLLDVLETARMAQSPSIPPTQLRVLSIIVEHGQMNMNRLADALDVVPSSASRLCDRLEATGLLRRLPDPRDRREVRLALTPTARRLLDDLRERRCAALAEVLNRMAPPARLEMVRALAAFAGAAAGSSAGAQDETELRSA